ncbi:MAG: branched-chain amino acid ABC transporter permease [Proteobacteria bacterium]|nr:branched-chain amino acid ABC transporter permease [Pseudomonadota bacterium]
MALLPCGVHFRTYRGDRAYFHTKYQWACFIAFLILLFTFPLWVGIRYVAMFNVTAIYIIAVVGLQITSGYTGQTNLGQSAFMGMGAFVCASLSTNLNLPFWLTIPAGGLGAAIFGALFGIPALRIKGFYLALTTIAAQIIFPILIMALPEKLAGGAIGLQMNPARLGPITFDSDVSMYYMFMIVMVVMVYFAFNLVRTRVGRVFVAIRDNDIAAEIMGVNLFYYKTLAFFIGAFYAGVAGGLWAYHLRYVGADQFTIYMSIWFVGMIIVGGLGSILGAIFGTIFLRILQELIMYVGPLLVNFFPNMGDAQMWYASMNIVLGGVIILFLIYEPHGLAHRWNIVKTNYRVWPFPYL